ncbi:MAG: tetratricopeptide repeat protein, partial [Planctomycetota bacterium]
MQSSYGQIGRIPASGLLAWAMAAMLIVGCGATGPKNQPAGELLPPADPPPAIDTDLAGLSGGHADPSSDPGDPTATGDPGETPSRIRVRTFDDLMKLKPEWIDPALGNLLMAYEAGYATREDVIEARAGIKRLVDAARQLVNLRDYHLLPPQERRRRDRANAVKIVETIVSMGFGFDKEDPDGHRPENLFLHHVLKRRRGYCVSLSLLTLSVAYYLNVPMHGVRAPGHLFVRFGSYSDVENDQRNFEMTDNGSERDNRHYMQRYSIHPQAIVNNAFLTNLDGRCVFSDVTSNLGSLCMLKDDVPKAIEWYRRAVALDPANPQAQYNLGTALARHNDPGGAIAAYREAIRLNPGDYFSLCARGQLYFENG